MATKKLMLQHNKEMRQNLYRDKEIFCHDNKSYGMKEFFRCKIKLSRDKNRRRTKIIQVKHVATKISMSRQTAQQATRIREEKSVATKEFSVATEIAKDLKKSCRNRENSVAIELTG